MSRRDLHASNPHAEMLGDELADGDVGLIVNRGRGRSNEQAPARSPPTSSRLAPGMTRTSSNFED